MIPVAFGGCAGWLHEGTARRGVVLCPPHGFEDLSARASLAALADALAARGLPTLRFDWPASANALGGADVDDAAADWVPAWQASVDRAIAWMKEHAGVADVVLAGCRLGGLLAAIEARGRDDVAALALIAPAVSGRYYLREMRILSKVMAPPSAANIVAAEPVPGLDVCGFQLTPATMAAIEPLLLAGVAGDTRAWPKDVLVLAPKAAAPAAAIAEMRARGSTVVEHEFVGYGNMICDPTASCVPYGDWARVVQWVDDLGRPDGAARLDIPDALLAAGGWCERGVRFGAGEALSGYLCAPAVGAAVCEPAVMPERGTGPAVLFLDGGRNYHIGWARQWVLAARSLAEQGIASLRFDFTGIGDTVARDEPELQPIYSERSTEEVRAAVDWLDKLGFGPITLVGVCSGAYAGLHAARSDPRPLRLVLVNLQCLAWTPDMGHDIERWLAIRRVEIAVSREASAAPAGTLGGLKARLLHRALPHARRAAGHVRRALKLAQPANALDPVCADPVPWLQDITARGGRVGLIYSRGDPGLEMLEPFWGEACARATAVPGVSLIYIENTDHNLTPMAARQALRGILASVARDES